MKNVLVQLGYLSCGINIKIVNHNSNNMGNRSRTEIVSNILDAANGGTTKTKIMYFAFLSYNQLNEYLSILIENNLIEYLDGTKTFKTTEKGLNLLKIHNEMAELLQQTTYQKQLINLIFFNILKHTILIFIVILFLYPFKLSF